MPENSEHPQHIQPSIHEAHHVGPPPDHCQELADVLPFSLGTWADQTWLRVVAAVVVTVLLVCFFCNRDTDSIGKDSNVRQQDDSRLIPFIVASTLCVVLGACYLRRLYELHVRVWAHLTITDILLPVFGLIMMMLVWGKLDLGLGLFHLFWHDNSVISFLAGFGVGLFWMVLAYLAYLLFVHDLYMQVHTAPRTGLTDIAGRRKKKEDFVNSTDPELYQCCLISWLVAPLIVLSFFPVINSAAEQYDRSGRLAFSDGFSRLAATVCDRWPFALGIFAGTGFIAMILDVWSRSTRNPADPVPPRRSSWLWFWDGLAETLSAFVRPLVIRLSEMQAWMNQYGLQLALIFTLLLMTAVPSSYIVSLPFMRAIYPSLSKSFPFFSALVTLATLLCWLAYLWARAPVQPASPVERWYWRVRLRTRNLFCIAAVVIGVLYLLNTMFDMFGLTLLNGFDSLPSALSITLLLTAFLIGYGWLRYYARGASLLALGLLFGGCAAMSGLQKYPHRLEALNHYYDDLGSHTYHDQFESKKEAKQKPSLYDYSELRQLAQKAAQQVKAGNPPNPEMFQALDNEEVLNNWDVFVRSDKFAGLSTAPKPPLIIVTSSGGASNSAIFTLNVLLELEQIYPGISRHMRIIAGASGGMLGSAYFRSILNKIRTEAKPSAVLPPEGDTAFDSHRRKISQDFLGPVAQQWAFKDMLMGFCPFPYYHDRGEVLEKVWGNKNQLGDGIATTFQKMRKEEANGEFPSLIFSPLLVEDGRQMLISTLDLDDIVEPMRGPDPDDHLHKLRAVEFFKLFPEAGGFQLHTATRLNCSFPFVAPAATLPTTPPRRVVDAGYYDNYGMTVAVSWAYRHKKWLREHTSEVIFLQLRPWYWVYYEDMRKEEVRRRTERDAKSVGPPLNPRYDRPVTDVERAKIIAEGDVYWNRPRLSFDEIVTPLQGGFGSLRASMIFRNAQQLQLLQEALPPCDTDSFRGVTSYTFVGNLESSMNWYLPHHLVMEIEAVVRKAANENWKPTKPGFNEWYVGKSSFEGAKLWNRSQFREFVKSPAVSAYFPKSRYEHLKK